LVCIFFLLYFLLAFPVVFHVCRPASISIALGSTSFLTRTLAGSLPSLVMVTPSQHPAKGRSSQGTGRFVSALGGLEKAKTWRRVHVVKRESLSRW
jgi:hypothetical protein